MSTRALRCLARAYHLWVCIALTVVLLVSPPLRSVGAAGVVFDVMPTAHATELPVVHVSGAISTNTTWTADAIYVADSSLTINSGVTLSVDPGVVVKLSSAGVPRQASWTLRARNRCDAVCTSTGLRFPIVS